MHNYKNYQIYSTTILKVPSRPDKIKKYLIQLQFIMLLHQPITLYNETHETRSTSRTVLTNSSDIFF